MKMFLNKLVEAINSNTAATLQASKMSAANTDKLAKDLESLTKALLEQNEAIDDLTEQVELLQRRLLQRVAVPFRVFQVREVDNMIFGKIPLIPSSKDVEKFKVSVASPSGSDPVVTTYLKADLVLDPVTGNMYSEEFSGEQGSLATISVVDIDDAGNPSEAATVEHTFTDTFAPPKPDVFAVMQTREE